jgi:hypothetical protein
MKWVTRMVYPVGNQGQNGEKIDYAYLPQISLNHLCIQDYGYYYLQQSRYDVSGRALYRGYGATSLAVNPLLQGNSTYYGWTTTRVGVSGISAWAAMLQKWKLHLKGGPTAEEILSYFQLLIKEYQLDDALKDF